MFAFAPALQVPWLQYQAVKDQFEEEQGMLTSAKKELRQREQVQRQQEGPLE